MHLDVDLKICCKILQHCETRHFPTHLWKTDRIFVKIISELYLWTRNSPLNFLSHLDTDSGFGPDSPCQRSALSKCSCYTFIVAQQNLMNL